MSLEQWQSRDRLSQAGTIPGDRVSPTGAVRSGVGMRYAKIVAGFASARERAEQYRQRAVQLNKMADAETYGRLRDQLTKLAREYQELAEMVLQAAD